MATSFLYVLNTRKSFLSIAGLSHADLFSQSAVVRGAALRGLEGIAPRMKHVRRHYGFAWGMPFREGIDPEGYAFFDSLDNTKFCRHRMNWLISKASHRGTFKSYLSFG